MSDSMIFKAIPLVMAEIGAIGKGKYNADQKFNYRGIEDVMNATQPAFIMHGVFVVPNVIDRMREERTTKSGGVMHITILRVKFTFYAADGSSIEATTEGEAQDMADKSTNKAMSAAFKYALFQVFNIPTAEMQDGDAETPEPLAPKGDDKAATAGKDATRAKGNTDQGKAAQDAKKQAQDKRAQEVAAFDEKAAKNGTLTMIQMTALSQLCKNPDGTKNEIAAARLKEIYNSMGYDLAADIKVADLSNVVNVFNGTTADDTSLPDDL